jgi:hypothetical protein
MKVCRGCIFVVVLYIWVLSVANEGFSWMYIRSLLICWLFLKVLLFIV